VPNVRDGREAKGQDLTLLTLIHDAPIRIVVDDQSKGLGRAIHAGERLGIFRPGPLESDIHMRAHPRLAIFGGQNRIRGTGQALPFAPWPAALPRNFLVGVPATVY
jgi:hypothetical protein